MPWKAVTVLYILFLIFGTLLISAAVCLVLPRLVVMVAMSGHVCRDRGIRRINAPHGSAIVCEPAPDMRRALEQYAVARTEGKTVFVGKWAPSVVYAEYDLYLYGGSGRKLKLLSVKELPSAKRGQRIPLPIDTLFVSPALRSVNGEAVRPAKRSFKPLLWAAALALFCAVALLLHALVFEIGFSHLFRDGFFLPEGSASFLIVMFLLSAATEFVAVFLLFFTKSLLSRRRGEGKAARYGAYSGPRLLFARVGCAFSNFGLRLKHSRPVLAAGRLATRLSLRAGARKRKREGRA